MLKTQLGKSFYLCNSFLLFAISFTFNPQPLQGDFFSKEKKESKISLLDSPDAKISHVSGNVELNKRNASAQLASKKPQITLNRKGLEFVKKYIKNSGDCLSYVRKRSLVPFSIIDSVFDLYKLPLELKYLAVIESELKPTAMSQVGARGPWQFMPATAQILGLKITRKYDERTDYYKSTIAAARYLRDLYSLFDDWLLVLAAYNGGPRPVYSAIQKSGSKNFWVLQDYLPSESKDHVKKFIATHYYFEGRGGVTTLTRSETVKYRKAVAAFAKSIYSPSIPDALPTGKYFAVNYEMIPQIEAEVYEMNRHFQKNQFVRRQEESSDEKFKRLMKESEESLNRATRII